MIIHTETNPEPHLIILRFFEYVNPASRRKKFIHEIVIMSQWTRVARCDMMVWDQTIRRGDSGLLYALRFAWAVIRLLGLSLLVVGCWSWLFSSPWTRPMFRYRHRRDQSPRQRTAQPGERFHAGRLFHGRIFSR
jgi:hypothetical protein